jgi:tricarballylate dehydrogenase
VTCGITFTFGGLRINTNAQAISTDGEPVPGLYAALEVLSDSKQGAGKK